jgi:DNA repair protein RadC
MKTIPFQKNWSISKSTGHSFSSPAPVPALASVRLKELVPRYQDVTIRCPVGAYLTEIPAIHSSEEVYSLFAFLEFEARENFFALHLNAKNEIICLDQIAVGSLTAAIVHPREVFASVLLSAAAAVIFVHNHPSGNPTASREDLALHERLKKAGDLLGIRVLDGVIIGSKGRYISLATVSTTTEGEDVPDSSLFI